MSASIQAVLFDLDGTLLHNPMEEFLPPYFQLVSRRFAHVLPPADFIPRLIKATQIMIKNDGSATNHDVFMRVFPPMVGSDWDELEPIFMAFYAEDFPTLRAHTRLKPEARQVVQTAFDLGHAVVVATNPLFPEIAIRQRLDWAGVGDLPFDLVTTYENSRACKPNLLYFQHIAAHLGCAPQACLVVGDEKMDMVAGHLGCTTFLVSCPTTILDASVPAPTHAGVLADVSGLLRQWKDDG